MTELTERIRARAAAVGISIRQLHKDAGVAGNALWRWENVADNPRTALVAKLEAVLTKAEMEGET